MFKAIRYEKQILIVLLWSLLLFIGYNILTAEADEKYDKKICEQYNGKWLKYENDDDKRCVIEDEKDQQAYAYRPGFSKDGTHSDAEYGIEDLVSYDEEGNKIYPPNPAEKDSPKDICKNHDGKWKDGECSFPNDNERQDDEVGFDHTMEEEGLWDKYAQDKKAKKACDRAGLEMTKDGKYCETNNEKGEEDSDKFYREYDKITAEEQEGQDLPNTVGYETSEPVVEDWRNEVVETPEGPPPEQEFKDDYKIASPIVVEQEDNEDLPNTSGYQYSEPANEESEESSDESEEEEEDDEPEAEEEEEEPEEDNSDSES